MCILAWHWQPGAATELLLVANRDEFHQRPARALQVWQGQPILAGQDAQAGGTWLGLARGRRLAALTNYRSGLTVRPDAPSRGQLVQGFLASQTRAHDYLRQLVPHCADYNPFNLLVWDGEQLLGLESRHARIVAMVPGMGGVSNADFHTPWPKLARLQHGLAQALASGHSDDDHLLALLADPTQAPAHALPDTGVGLAREQWLSSIFIRSPLYGTRASSVVRVQGGSAGFTEQGFGADGPLARHTVPWVF